MSSLKLKAHRAIDRAGMLLVFPIENRPQPASLWSAFYPRTKMKWEWDSHGDHRVSDLWSLREELSRSEKVVYAKWYRGRATFFSRDAFVYFRTVVQSVSARHPLTPVARALLETFEESSPISTKTLKEVTDLRGRDNESLFTRSLKELWERFLIVGFGEFDDGAFPSLGMGAANLLFEDLCLRASEMDPADAEVKLKKLLGEESLFFKELSKLKTKWR